MAEDWVETFYKAYTDQKRAEATSQRRQEAAQQSMASRWQDLVDRLNLDVESLNGHFTGVAECQLRFETKRHSNAPDAVVFSSRGSLSIWKDSSGFQVTHKGSASTDNIKIEIVPDSESDSVLYKIGSFKTANSSEISERLLTLILCK